jgi:molybdate transport system permease protein
MMDVWSHHPLWVTILLSLKVACCATFLASIFGISLGYILASRKFLGKNMIDVLLTLPMVMPPTVLGYYLLVVFGKNGFIGQSLALYFNVHLVFTWQGAVVAACIVIFPLILKPARASFENIDPHFKWVAKTLGLSKTAIFFRVTLPLAWKSISAGVLLAFARSLGEFGATLMLAGNIPGKTQTLSIAIYEAAQAGDDHLANMLVVLISCICMIILLAANKLSGSRSNDF